MSADEAPRAETPAFVGDAWLFNAGWSFAETPTAGLTDPSLLASPRAWDRFLVVFEEAKRGRFEHVAQLAELLGREQSHPLFLGTMYLAAAIGSAAEVQALTRWIDSEWFTQAIAAVELTGDPALVEALLRRRRGAGQEVTETIESAISHLLEIEPDRFYDTGLDEDAYDTLVRAEIAGLMEKHGADVRFALGAPLRARTLLAKLTDLSRLGRDPLDEASAVIGKLGFHLETLTGLPSAGVVTVDDGGNDVVDRSRLQRFLDAVGKWDEKHRPRSGRRMFFGHAVP